MKTTFTAREKKSLSHYLGIALIYAAGLMIVALQLRSMI